MRPFSISLTWIASGIVAVALALASPGPTTAATVVTGVIPVDTSPQYLGAYLFDWASDPGNRATLDLEFRLKDDVPTPASFILNTDISYWRYTPDFPPTSPEAAFDGSYTADCTFAPIPPPNPTLCLVDQTGSTPRDFHLRFTTDWGRHGRTLWSPYWPYQGQGPPPQPIHILVGLPLDPAGGPVNPDPFVATFTITMIPEPDTWGLMIAGFVGLGAALRGQRRRGAASIRT